MLSLLVHCRCKPFDVKPSFTRGTVNWLVNSPPKSMEKSAFGRLGWFVCVAAIHRCVILCNCSGSQVLLKGSLQFSRIEINQGRNRVQWQASLVSSCIFQCKWTLRFADLWKPQHRFGSQGAKKYPQNPTIEAGAKFAASDASEDVWKVNGRNEHRIRHSWSPFGHHHLLCADSRISCWMDYSITAMSLDGEWWGRH